MRYEKRETSYLPSEICKSNYKNHSAEIFTREMQWGVRSSRTSTPAYQSQTQSNRPANCQTSNDEMKSNRNCSRSRSRSGNGYQPTSPYPCPQSCPMFMSMFDERLNCGMASNSSRLPFRNWQRERERGRGQGQDFRPGNNQPSQIAKF